MSKFPNMSLGDMAKDGSNLVLSKTEKDTLIKVCDKHLVRALECLRPQYIVGVGKFAEGRARSVLKTLKFDATLGCILHPSPASPEANRGWSTKAEQQLKALGIHID